MNFWTEEKVKEALGNAKTYNFPENWSSNGLSIWHKNFIPENMLLVRSKGDTRGAIITDNSKIIEDCAAIIAKKTTELYKYNKPIIEISGDSGNAIINLARYIRKFFNGKVVGITGSSGKSTTTRMLYDIFSSKYNVNSNIVSKANTTWGIAWNMTQFDINADYWIIETSLGGGMSRNSALTKPYYAIITNVAPVHLTGNMELKDIAEEKSRIFHSMKEGQYAIIYNEMNFFDIVKAAAKEKDLKIITFGESENCDIRVITGDNSKFIINNQEYPIESTFGKHILLDMAAALAVAIEEGIPIEDSLNVLRKFKSLEGRGEEFQVVFEDGKTITVTDESYNANPLSMQAAILAFGEKYSSQHKILILGDMAECGADAEKYHREISVSIDKIKPDKLLLCGKDIMYLYDEIKDRYTIKLYDNIMDLYNALPDETADGDCVMFKSSHSGNLYRIIEKLKGE